MDIDSPPASLSAESQAMNGIPNSVSTEVPVPAPRPFVDSNVAQRPGPIAPGKADGSLTPPVGGTPFAAPLPKTVGQDFGWTFSEAEVKRQARGLGLLSLFHGPLSRSDGLDHYVET